jgi:WS/DGAT/MGAT family acyltransferase
MHHAIADGTTARGIMMALHHPRGAAIPKPPVGVREPMPSMTEMTLRAVLNNANRLWQMEKHLLRALPGIGESVLPAAGKWFSSVGSPDQEEGAESRRWPVPATMFNQEMDYRRVFQARVYPLEDIARMRRAVEGSTVNDVVLVLVGEALRLYMQRAKKSVKADLFAFCPINIRSDKRTNASLAGNDISVMTANLRTSEPDLRERLRKVTGSTKASKKVQEASSVKELISVSKQAPNLLLALASKLVVQTAMRASSRTPLSNAIVTNVPGPQEPLYFMGAKLVMFTGGGPLSPMTGIIVPITSYDGRLIISFTAAASWVTDPQGLAECFDESFETLKQALQPAAEAKSSGPGRPRRRKAAKPAKVAKTPRAKRKPAARAAGAKGKTRRRRGATAA